MKNFLVDLLWYKRYIFVWKRNYFTIYLFILIWLLKKLLLSKISLCIKIKILKFSLIGISGNLFMWPRLY